MVVFFDDIPDFLAAWIPQQKLFWVASAPLTPDGYVNVSPKGVEGTFHVVNAKKVWYEDISGSGIETIAHLRENGRITVMFSAFEGPPRIARLFGKGTVYEYGTPEYETLLPPGKRQVGSRAVIMVDVHKVSTSCGYAVPFYTFKAQRTRLLEFFKKKEAADIEAEVGLEPTECTAPPRPENGLKQYWVAKNLKSINGLPGIASAHESLKPFVPTKIVFKKDNEGTPTRWGGLSVLVDPKVIVAFGLGVVVSTTYVKLMKSLVALTV